MGFENYGLPRSIPIWSLQTADERDRFSQPCRKTCRHPGDNAQLEYDNRDPQGSAVNQKQVVTSLTIMTTLKEPDMRRPVIQLVALGIVLASTVSSPARAVAQWIKYPTAGVPTTSDGKPDLSAPAPQAADGKPDFSGIWMAGNTNCARGGNSIALNCGAELPMGREGINFGVNLPGGLPYQPWLADLVKRRTAENAKEDPHIRCLPDTFLRAYSLPHLLKFVQTPGLLVMLNEMNAGYRQVFIDGRPLPPDPTPS